MSIPVPLRGLCSVSDIEQLLRPASRYGDFKYHGDTQPSLQEVCNEIDWAYDQLLPEWNEIGFVIPITNTVALNYVKLLNALQAAINIETGVHSGAPPRTTTKSQKLQKRYDDLMLRIRDGHIKFDADAITDDYPATSLHDLMFSTLKDLYDTDAYDKKPRQAFFRIDKHF
jgi:hypothetical protein